ncbi:MAG: hypothetical protein HDS11_04235 [Bacteroides sp.]|nr:hypothetical protein [Bacteroides sp.]
MKKRTIVLFSLLLVFLLSMIVGFNVYSNKKKQEAEKIREEQIIKRRNRNKIHFDNRSLNDSVNNKRLSSDMAKSNLETAIKYSVSLIGPTKAVRNQDIEANKLSDNQKDKVDSYFKTFDTFNNLIQLLNHSMPANSNESQQKVVEPTPGTTYTIDLLNLDYLKDEDDNNNYTFNVLIRYHANNLPEYEVRLVAEVDSLTGKVVDIQSNLNS